MRTNENEKDGKDKERLCDFCKPLPSMIKKLTILNFLDVCF